jgi:hypothetical protein
MYHETEIKPLPFPLITRLLKKRQDDLVNYIWENDLVNAKKAEDDIKVYRFKLELGDIYEVPF